ncbi:MAG: ABC transporter ATP-binding protein [Gammaproteobacteria bacterium]|nr:ABC transporter ATP-binding protein [Gemmatimonadota bacterium]MXY65574.1 ABC transporter ATP-binding protein [Gammaproteobacteria bacterium]MYG67473.1 ABC transporter ATP-binding protein [Gammaproteobacteria bacterium]
MSQSDEILTIKGLHIEGKTDEGWSEIVKGVDLSLKKGEILGLIGESGAGKSTIGLAAMGYARGGCRISAGEIIFDGHNLLEMSNKGQRRIRGRRIAYVAQSAAASFNPTYKLIDQYSEGPVFHHVMSKSEAEHDAKELYRRMQLPDPEMIGYRYPHQVSGGQLQRAITAMAMSCRPDIIIFDEPTTALDVTTQIEVLSAIRDIVNQSGTAAIYITHDLAVVAQMADRVKVLLKGAEIEEADTRTMLRAPRDTYTKSLWAVRSFQATPKKIESTTRPVVSVQNVSAAYETQLVLTDVSFDIFPCQTVAVVGESGSGKSTAARVMTGLLEPSSGSVKLRDEPLPSVYTDRSKKQLQEIQMIYQSADTALNPKQRIREIIGWPIEFYTGLKGNANENRIRELLTMIEMDPDEFIDRRPGELSGGQKQRIGIARALAADPSMIICDEVTSALDQLVAEGILRLLDKLQQDLDLAYMFITHDIATVRAIADDVVVMKAGKVVEAGPKAEVFTPPHDPYTELLLSSVPEMDPDWLDNVLQGRASSGN